MPLRTLSYRTRISIPRSSLIIDDLAHLSNDALRARSLAAFQKLALWLLLDARAPRRLLDNFDAWLTTFAEAERAPAGIDAIATLLTYMFRVIDPAHHRYSPLGRVTTTSYVPRFTSLAPTPRKPP